MIDNKEKDYSERVMEEISKRKVAMRPRWYFSAISLVLGVILITALFSAIIFFSFGLFKMRHVNPLSFLSFGSAGWLISAKIVPWDLIGVTVLGLVLTWVLIRQFDLSYKMGFGLLALILIGGVVIVSFLLDRNEFGEFAEKSGLVGKLLQHESFGGTWVEGRVVNLQKDAVIVKTHSGRDVLVRLDNDVKYINSDQLKQSDLIKAIGKKQGGEFSAELLERETE